MSKERLGRSNPERTISGSRRPSRSTTSAATSSVAVAVQAMTAGRPSRSSAFGRRR